MAKNVIFTAAIMDCLHKGHLNLLRTMRKHGNHSIVILHDDYSCFQIKDKFPIQTLAHRIRNVELSGLADEVLITTSTDPAAEFERVLNSHPRALFMRGDDNMNPPGKWMLDKKGARQKYIPYTPGISSTQIRNELLNN